MELGKLMRVTDNDPELDEELKNLTPEELLIYNLVRSQIHARQALDLVYNYDGPKRSIWYRVVLGRAQSILMSLVVRELGRSDVV